MSTRVKQGASWFLLAVALCIAVAGIVVKAREISKKQDTSQILRR